MSRLSFIREIRQICGCHHLELIYPRTAGADKKIAINTYEIETFDTRAKKLADHEPEL